MRRTAIIGVMLTSALALFFSVFALHGAAPARAASGVSATHIVSAKAHVASHRTLQLGVSGIDVQHLQEELQKLTYLPQGTQWHDGSFEESTYEAVIAFQKYTGLERDGVVGPRTRAKLEHASKPTPQSYGDPNRIEVLRARQVLLLIRNNHVVWTVPVSTGRPGLETELGRFRVYDKNPNAYSYVYNAPMPYASFFNGGDAIHEDSEVPVYPYSHGCVRTPPAFAPLLYTMDPMGSQVIVVNR